MVTHKEAADLMKLILTLTSVYERCRSASKITPTQYIQVKGSNSILDALQKWYPFIDRLAKNYPNLSNVANEIDWWIKYLDRNYTLKNPPPLIDSGPQFHYLQHGDASKLSDDSLQWICAIINEYNKQGTVLIKEEFIEELRKYFEKSNIDKLTKQDLNDALDCILHLLPTPAAMISLRVAESIVRRYYKKITGNDPINKNWDDSIHKNWGGILKELEESKKVKSSILGYLKYLKEKRNEAQHPDKRFTQEESEELLIKIKGLIEELSKD